MPKTTKTKPATTKTTSRFAGQTTEALAEVVNGPTGEYSGSTRRAAKAELDRRAAAAANDLDALFLKLAQEHIGARIETLETRNSDSLDFFDCSVAGLRDALRAAYAAGKAAR